MLICNVNKDSISVATGVERLYYWPRLATRAETVGGNGTCKETGTFMCNVGTDLSCVSLSIFGSLLPLDVLSLKLYFPGNYCFFFICICFRLLPHGDDGIHQTRPLTHAFPDWLIDRLTRQSHLSRFNTLVLVPTTLNSPLLLSFFFSCCMTLLFDGCHHFPSYVRSFVCSSFSSSIAAACFVSHVFLSSCACMFLDNWKQEGGAIVSDAAARLP